VFKCACWRSQQINKPVTQSHRCAPPATGLGSDSRQATAAALQRLNHVSTLALLHSSSCFIIQHAASLPTCHCSTFLAASTTHKRLMQYSTCPRASPLPYVACRPCVGCFLLGNKTPNSLALCGATHVMPLVVIVPHELLTKKTAVRSKEQG
jgi:hypothetical protein